MPTYPSATGSFLTNAVEGYGFGRRIQDERLLAESNARYRNSVSAENERLTADAVAASGRQQEMAGTLQSMYDTFYPEQGAAPAAPAAPATPEGGSATGMSQGTAAMAGQGQTSATAAQRMADNPLLAQTRRQQMQAQYTAARQLSEQLAQHYMLSGKPDVAAQVMQQGPAAFLMQNIQRDAATAMQLMQNASDSPAAMEKAAELLNNLSIAYPTTDVFHFEVDKRDGKLKAFVWDEDGKSQSNKPILMTAGTLNTYVQGLRDPQYLQDKINSYQDMLAQALYKPASGTGSGGGGSGISDAAAILKAISGGGGGGGGEGGKLQPLEDGSGRVFDPTTRILYQQQMEANSKTGKKEPTGRLKAIMQLPGAPGEMTGADKAHLLSQLMAASGGGGRGPTEYPDPVSFALSGGSKIVQDAGSVTPRQAAARATDSATGLTPEQAEAARRQVEEGLATQSPIPIWDAENPDPGASASPFELDAPTRSGRREESATVRAIARSEFENEVPAMSRDEMLRWFESNERYLTIQQRRIMREILNPKSFRGRNRGR